MHTGQLVFAQLLQWFPHYEFQRLVAHYRAHYKVHHFSCWDQFLCMLFAQLTYRESLRDIESCLRARPTLLYHMGLRGRVSRSTLADANERRPWQLYADLAQRLIARARRLYAGEALAVELDETVYALDSTTIDLCLELFPWARFRRHKAAIKLHTLLDLRGALPTLIYLSDGKLHDVNVLDQLPLEAGAYYVMDRGYVDFGRLHRFLQAGAFFVTRAKRRLSCRVAEARAVAPGGPVRADQQIRLRSARSRQAYPEGLRRIRYYDEKQSRMLVFLTNNHRLPATVIAQLYRCRWQVELFFKWIKQNLRLKSFYGYSDNAVRTQVWIAVCTYVLAAMVRKELKLEASLSRMLQILSVSVFEKVPLAQLFAENQWEAGRQNDTPSHSNQLMLNIL
jgi:hypothetical protein